MERCVADWSVAVQSFILRRLQVWMVAWSGDYWRRDLLQRIRYVDLPAIIPTAVIMLILEIGWILNMGYEKVFAMQESEQSLCRKLSLPMRLRYLWYPPSRLFPMKRLSVCSSQWFDWYSSFCPIDCEENWPATIHLRAGENEKQRRLHRISSLFLLLITYYCTYFRLLYCIRWFT